MALSFPSNNARLLEVNTVHFHAVFQEATLSTGTDLVTTNFPCRGWHLYQCPLADNEVRRFSQFATLNTGVRKAGISRWTPLSVYFTEFIGWARIWITGMSHFLYDVA